MNSNKVPKKIYLSDDLKKIKQSAPKRYADIESLASSIVINMRLKEARVGANLSQAELSRKSGIGRDKISNIENGKLNPTVETLAKIAVALDKSLEVSLR